MHMWFIHVIYQIGPGRPQQACSDGNQGQTTCMPTAATKNNQPTRAQQGQACWGPCAPHCAALHCPSDAQKAAQH